MTSVIRQVYADDTTSLVGAGKAGLAFGDITAKYLVEGGVLTPLTTETITTLGTYQAPSSAAHIRIKELNSADPTKGVYEVHFHDTQVASSGKRLWLFLSAANSKFQTLYVDLSDVSGRVPAALGANSNLKVDVQDLLGTAWLAPAVAGTPDVNAKKIGGSAQTGLDIATNYTAARAAYLDILSSGTFGNSALKTLIDAIAAQITALNNLSALMNVYGSPLLEIPDSSSTPFAFTVVVRDSEGKLVDLDGSPSLTAANAAGTDRSANLSVVSHPAVGRYTFTYSVSSAAAEESLRIAITGTVSAEGRYIEWIGAVVNSDTLTAINAVAANVVNIQGRIPAALTADGNIKADALKINGAVPNDLAAAGVRAAVGLAVANLDTQLMAIQAGADDIQTRIPTALSGGRMDSVVGSMGSGVIVSGSFGSGATLPRVALVDVTTTNMDMRGTDGAALAATWTNARAGYLDNLNVGGAVASHADVLAINQSASKHVLIQTVGQYEKPDSGSTTYTVEVRTFNAATGAAQNADSTPTLTVTGQTSGDLAANLSVATNPATGLYRWTYTVASGATVEPVRFDVSAVIAASTFALSTFTQVVDFTSATWTTADASHLTAVFNKLPANNIADETLVLAAIAALNNLSSAGAQAAAVAALTAYSATKVSDIPTSAANAAAAAAQVTTDHGAGSYTRNTEPPTAATNAAAVAAQITTDHGVGSYVNTGGAAPTAVEIREEIDANSTQLQQIITDIGSIGGAVGPGEDPVMIRWRDNNGDPVADGDVWITNMADVVIAGTVQTNSEGEYTFLLTYDVHYKLWAQKDGVNSILGEEFTASAD